MGAVATTTYAGILSIQKGISPPIGSLTQMGHIRIGDRSDNEQPLIKDFVPLANLDDIVFVLLSDGYVSLKPNPLPFFK